MMTRCRNCNGLFSTALDHCPTCGKRSRKARTRMFLGILSVIVFGVAIWVIIIAIRKMSVADRDELEVQRLSVDVESAPKPGVTKLDFAAQKIR